MMDHDEIEVNLVTCAMCGKERPRWRVREIEGDWYCKESCRFKKMDEIAGGR